MSRRGYTLIEVLVTVSLVTVALTLLATWLTTVMRSQRIARDHLLEIQTRDRLARQFREDVHQARRIESTRSAQEPDAGMRLALVGGRVVTYAMRGQLLERVEQAGDKTLREQFQLEDAEAHFEVIDQHQPARAVLVLTTPASSGRNSASAGSNEATLRIEAVVGSNGRFAAGGTP